MPTTVNIATPILEELKQIRSKDGGSLDELVSGLLAKPLKTCRSREAYSGIDWVSKPMHVRVDLGGKDTVYALLFTYSLMQK